MSGYRRPSGGKVIERGKSITFTFDGKQYFGLAGDTLASALIAGGVSVVGRSFKYHRPRGIVAAGVDEPNALVTVLGDGAREPNIRATEIEIHDGLVCESQNRFPSLDFDMRALNQLGGDALAAGFYYKTFMGPARWPFGGTRTWMAFERQIRRAAGLGRAGTESDTSRYDRVNAHCDTLVVGGGKPGIVQALEAARKRRRVIVCEIDPTLGGYASWSGDPDISAMITQLQAMDNVQILTRTTAWGIYDGNAVAALERVSDHRRDRAPGEARQRMWIIRAGHVALATGAFERPLVFPGNDRPGVMLASAAQRYAAMYGVLPGKRIAIVTNNDSAYTSAIALKARDANVITIIDLRSEVSGGARSIASVAGARLRTGQAVVATAGTGGLDSIQVAPFDHRTRRPTGRSEGISCDCLLMSGGWSPAIHLASHAGGAPRWDDTLKAFLAPEDGRDLSLHGAAAGDFVFGAGLSPAPAPVYEVRAPGKAFVDFQHDVTADDVRLAHREGFHSVEHVKRYTTLGMATDQGKTSSLPGQAILADALGRPLEQVGTTRFRPPFTPVSLGSIAAERFGDLHPERITPIHDWHVKNGARMVAAGHWQRPECYNRWKESVEQAYIREAKTVRRGVGIVDVSTLGKIDIQGPDAAAFLDRVYTNGFARLPVGKSRYGLMLREDGFVFDDGTTWRLAPDRYLMTTTTANAGPVMQHLEYYLNVIWPDIRVHLTSVTDQWAAMAVAGPHSRDVLAAIVIDTDVDNLTLPPMGIVHGRIAEVPVMICRLSFSGERAYEVYCGAHHGAHVWNALIAAGEPWGILPYGLEALGALRIEKGHVTGAEIDGRTTARDLNLDWMLSTKKPFIGSAMMDRLGLVPITRQALVGVVSINGEKFHGGSHIVESANPKKPGPSLGHVTAMCYSPVHDRYIGLALVSSGRARLGARLYATDPVRSASHVPVEIVRHVMVDPSGDRMHG
ncbi:MULTISPECIES: 2Fe-2S iron-sulfur cluster-binding protein [unclassified Roseitalea]|uniref:2Fe-2S iron-sulfur cluster-binding protein n=1 Tax=unclassified Roseitalea TaxID=2639107 RepID=UPI00273FA4A6|nr:MULTISPECIES: 2Fe-2S iron-sulfur cluster-binding protein [unclassified Roseitalea]